MIKNAIINTLAAWFCGCCIGLLLCFYDYNGQIYFAVDFVPNAIIFGGICAVVAWVYSICGNNNQ